MTIQRISEIQGRMPGESKVMYCLDSYINVFEEAKKVAPKRALPAPEITFAKAEDMPEPVICDKAKEVLDKVAVKEEDIRALVDDKVVEIAKKYGLELSPGYEVNTDELKELFGNHMKESCEFATNVYNQLPENKKKEINLEDLQIASILHDYGKVLIPSAYLNRTNNQPDAEKRAIQAHSEIGEYLLRKQGIVSEGALEMIRHHHTSMDGKKGYPCIEDYKTEKKPSLGAQVLSASDVMSALLDERSYKPAYSTEFSTEIMENTLYATNRMDKDVFKAILSISPHIKSAPFPFNGPKEPDKKTYQPNILKAFINGYDVKIDYLDSSISFTKRTE